MTAQVTHNTTTHTVPAHTGAGTGKGHLMNSTPTSMTATTTRRLRTGVLALGVVGAVAVSVTACANDAPEPTPAATSPADLDDDHDDRGDLDDDEHDDDQDDDQDDRFDD